MVATMIASIAGAALAALISYTSRSFAALANYSDLNRSSLKALDYLTRDVRGASSVASFTTNQITFNMGAGKPTLSYSYSSTNRTLTRSDGTTSRVLLPDCDKVTFAMYQRTPVAGSYDQYPVADKTTCKVVTVEWTCTKKVLGKNTNTQHTQSAKVSLRKA